MEIGDRVNRGDLFDVVCLGETMVAFVSGDDPKHWVAVPAGAESNVAVGITRLGCSAQWVSRLGDDPLGRFLEDSIAASGVDVAVVRDGDHPTGVMTKYLSGSTKRSQYYRSQSAARRLSPDDLTRAGKAKWVHVTGITPALSPSAAEMVAAVVARRSEIGARISFDVNHRPVLWSDPVVARAVLLNLARGSDVVFVGDDEAKAVFGTASERELAELILRRDDQELIVKRGAVGASVMTLAGATSETALSADVVDVTGAGDAFAAGYLAATCFGWAPRDRLRLGHLMGSRVVGVVDDVVPPFADLDALTPESLARRWESEAG